MSSMDDEIKIHDEDVLINNNNNNKKKFHVTNLKFDD